MDPSRQFFNILTEIALYCTVSDTIPFHGVALPVEMQAMALLRKSVVCSSTTMTRTRVAVLVQRGRARGSGGASIYASVVS